MKKAIKLLSRIKKHRNFFLLAFNEKDLDKNGLRLGDKVKAIILE